MSAVDLQSNTAYAIEARQTLDQKGKTRAELYAHQVVEISPELRRLGITHLACDAWYSKLKFVDPVIGAQLHLVGKLRNDADLRWLYDGQYSGVGRPKRYDGKVNFDRDISRFAFVGMLDDGIEVHTQIVYAKFLKRKIRVVMLRWRSGQVMSRALFYSTDTELDAMTLLAYYKARFQIEFLFRDAKQFTGLTHCQSRKKEAIHTHVNASLSALNILKAEDRQAKQSDDQTVISIASWKRREFNQHFMERLFSELGLSLKSEKVAQVYKDLSNYGVIAA